MRFGSAFVRLYTKDLKEKNGARWLHYHYRELHQAAGVKKPSDRQKAKAVWIMKAATDRDEASSSCGAFRRSREEFQGSAVQGPLGKTMLSCSGTESTSCSDVCEHNNECRALEVGGLDWSSEVVAFFLEDWELARVALSCRMAFGPPLPRDERCVPRKLPVTVFAMLTVFEAFGRFSHLVRAVTGRRGVW